MRILGCRISDDDNSMTIDWYEENEQKEQGGTVYQTLIAGAALEDWKHVGYYSAEVREDLEELVRWFVKYSSGRYEDA